eukprot:GILK01007920.1.p1 GENE.GILK01007920.1~~GILK01007920.1.p1  ORF type:complete len:837 (-),score=174.74 GILK01007920.1:118-2286(-)
MTPTPPSHPANSIPNSRSNSRPASGRTLVPSTSGSQLGSTAMDPAAAMEIKQNILDTIIQMAMGVNQVHKTGLVHQDLKPSAFVLTNEGLIKLNDMGLNLRPVKTDLKPDFGQAPFAGGTAAYWSPEQALCQQKLSRSGNPIEFDRIAKTLPLMSQKTDIYAFGNVMLETYLGSRPWSNGDAGQEVLLREIDKRSPEIPSMDGLVPIIKQCLQYLPDQRQQSMEDVVNQLKGLYEEVCGKKYIPKLSAIESKQMADDLNRKALVAIDSKDVVKAVEFWKEALEYDPQHVEALYNLSMHQWRTEAENMDTIARKLAALPKSHQMIGTFHMQRGDWENAVKSLERAKTVALDGEVEDIERLLEEAKAKKTKEHQMTFQLDLAQTARFVGINLYATYAIVVDDQWMTNLFDLFTGEGMNEKVDVDVVVDTSKSYLPSRPICSNARGDVIVSCNGGKMKVVNLATGQVNYLGSDMVVRDAVVSGNGKQLLALYADDGSTTMYLWEISTQMVQKTFAYIDGVCTALATSRDMKRAVCCSATKLVLWNLEAGESQMKIIPDAHQGRIDCVAMSSDGKLIVSGGSDKQVKIWAFDTCEIIRVLEGHKDDVTDVIITYDDTWIVSGSLDGSVIVWDPITGAPERRITGYYHVQKPNKVVTGKGLAATTDEAQSVVILVRTEGPQGFGEEVKMISIENPKAVKTDPNADEKISYVLSFNKKPKKFQNKKIR